MFWNAVFHLIALLVVLSGRDMTAGQPDQVEYHVGGKIDIYDILDALYLVTIAMNCDFIDLIIKARYNH